MKRGFTLVELLVVVAIISILTIITVAQFQTAQKKANDADRKGDLSALAKALEMYYTDYGKFPTASAGGIIQVTDNGKAVGVNNAVWGGTFTDNGSPPYIYMKVMPMEKNKSLPLYCYVTDATGTEFGLFAMMENTTDSQCIMNGGVGAYVHCGGQKYCFSYVSPNAAVSDLNGLIP